MQSPTYFWYSLRFVTLNTHRFIKSGRVLKKVIVRYEETLLSAVTDQLIEPCFKSIKAFV